MLDNEDETPAVPSPQNVSGTPTVSVLQSTAAVGTPTVSASQSSMTAPATQAVQHLTSRPKDIRMQAFIVDSDPDETGCRWDRLLWNRLQNEVHKVELWNNLSTGHFRQGNGWHHRRTRRCAPHQRRLHCFWQRQCGPWQGPWESTLPILRMWPHLQP